MGLLATKTLSDFGFRADGFEPRSFTFPRSRERALFDLAGGGIGLLIVAVLLLRAEPFEYQTLFVLGGVAMMGLAVYDFLHPSKLELTPRGFHLDEPFGATSGTWVQCGAFEVQYVHKRGRMVVWDTPGAGFFGGGGHMVNPTELSHEDLAALMNLYRQAAFDDRAAKSKT